MEPFMELSVAGTSPPRERNAKVGGSANAVGHGDDAEGRVPKGRGPTITARLATVNAAYPDK